MKPNIVIRPFQIEDAESLKMDTIDVGANLLDWSKGAGLIGPAFTGLVDGRVAGCGGISIYWSGVGEAWSVFAAWASQYKRYMLLHCRRFLDEQQAGLRLRRVHATLRTDLPESWLEHLGFVKENPDHPMRYYCADGCDAFMWVRIREGV